jgi:hypothetical protein
MGVAGFCAMIGLNIAAAIAGMIPTGSGASEAGAVSGGGAGSGNYNRNFDPNSNLADQFCKNPNDPACNCSGPNAANNILCGPGSIKNVQATLNAQKDKLKDGSTPIPAGQTVEGLLASIDQANQGLDSLLGGTLPGVDSGVLGESLADLKEGGAGKGVGSDILAGGSGSFDSDLLGLNKTKAGPADRKGLGNIISTSGLDAIDEVSGKSLTIWQRLSRRMQGDQSGSRAYTMAKTEWLRKNTMQPSKIITSAAEVKH